MTIKPLKTEVFTATHECGRTWVLAVNAKRGADYAAETAKVFARNYCLKHVLPGKVTMVSQASGREITVSVDLGKMDYCAA